MALPLREGSYKWSGGKSVSVFDSTVAPAVAGAVRKTVERAREQGAEAVDVGAALALGEETAKAVEGTDE